jgi:NADH-quinone oxidoreductase subunit G
MNEARLLIPYVREEGARKIAAWGSLLPDVAFRLMSAAEKGGPDRVAVIASPQSSNEELYLLRCLATSLLGTKNLAFTHRVAGDGFADDFLIQADKNPNSNGARLLGIPGGEAFDALLSKIAGGGIDALLVFGNVLGALSEEETAALLSKVPFVAQVGTNEGPVSKAATANHAGRVQGFRFGFPPRGKAKNPVEILVSLGNRLGAGWTFAGEASVFKAIAETEAPFAGMSYDSIGMFGQEIRK